MKTWKNVSIFVAVPAILICAYNAWVKEKEHHTHPRPEFLEYAHLRIRSKVSEIDLPKVMSKAEYTTIHVILIYVTYRQLTGYCLFDPFTAWRFHVEQ